MCRHWCSAALLDLQPASGCPRCLFASSILIGVAITILLSAISYMSAVRYGAQ